MADEETGINRKVWVCCCGSQWTRDIKLCPECGCTQGDSPYQGIGLNGLTPAVIASSGAVNENAVGLISGID